MINLQNNRDSTKLIVFVDIDWSSTRKTKDPDGDYVKQIKGSSEVIFTKDDIFNCDPKDLMLRVKIELTPYLSVIDKKSRLEIINHFAKSFTDYKKYLKSI